MQPHGILGLILLACWVVFIGYWIVSAFSAKRTLNRRFFGAGIWWRLFIVVAVIAIVKVQPQALYFSPSAANIWWGVLGDAYAIAGVSIAV